MDSSDYLPILSEKYYSEATEAEIAQQPIGTGPYVVTEYVKDDHITLELRDDYWGSMPPNKTVIYRPIPDNQTRLAELLAGNVDIALNISPDDIERIESTDGVRIETVSGGRDVFIAILCDQEPFDNVQVRQALNYAVDLEAIFESLLYGYGERLATPSNMPTKVEPYSYDPEKAAALLDEAGAVDTDGDGIREWNGEPLEIELGTPNGRYVKDVDISQAIAADLTAIGIKTEAKAYEWSVYVDMIVGETLPPLFFLGLGSSFNGQQELLYVQKDFGFNSTQWENDEFETKFAELAISMDQDERRQLVDELDEIVHDQAPWIFVWKQVDFYGASDRVNFTPRADELIMLFDVTVNQ
jgi:peptide/nickel transport system substrate-binding protein